MLFFIHFNYTEKQIINNMIQQNFMKMIFSNIYDIKHKPFLYLNAILYVVARFYSNDRKFQLNCSWYISDTCTGLFEWTVLID